ncbi:MAG: hypothetical protein ACI9VR_004075 [Cognaticolwellia sp.]|jgi:hypothetical protein
MDARALLEMEIQAPDGSVVGPVDLHLIRERIYAGRYKGLEQVRIRGGAWRGIVSFPELAEVLGIVGVDVQALQIRDRQAMTGWKAAVPKKSSQAGEDLVPVQAAESPGEKPKEAKRKLLIPLIVAGLAGVAAVGLAVSFLR